ncbi:hypothetical protein B0T10DRAFT_485022 [Thelonectria olida]|uniref:Uncharacterized protein n=1 Tax=Thelonectria olida TaxID=1576542 RepID=A0A9P8W9A8_9HYPO|nr:hypothetical protein B0T10DRAFT_485022 [Thelonectria olida]
MLCSLLFIILIERNSQLEMNTSNLSSHRHHNSPVLLLPLLQGPIPPSPPQLHKDHGFLPPSFSSIFGSDTALTPNCS